MKIEILFHPSKLGSYYTYHLYDGPDGIDEYTGAGETLGEVFEKIITWRALNSLNYTIEFENEKFQELPN